MEALAAENDLYAPVFAALESERGRTEPAWLAEIRRRAFERFADLGFPTPKLEAWKYTNAAPIARTPWRLAARVEDPQDHWSSATLSGKLNSGLQLVFVNGHLSRALSKLPSVGTGAGQVRIWGLGEVINRHPAWLESSLSRHADWEKNAFTAWNTGFFHDGAFVALPRGLDLQEPIHLVFLSGEPEEASVSHPRNLIVAEEGSQATIIETYFGAAGTRYLTNSVTEIVVGDGAVIDHYKVQEESLSAFHVHTVQVRQERSSRFTSHNVALGGALARTDVNVLFAAQGSECTLNGLFIGDGTQHLDNHTLIDHAKPHCASRELYKGILGGHSRGVFHGTIVVRPDAQKTDAMQTNKNLLLSREALVDSIPALEIHADDVKCKHASTIGQLDANALFYLRSRGIGEREARALLTSAFALDVTARIRVEPIRVGIEAFLSRRLGGAAPEPRLGVST